MKICFIETQFPGASTSFDSTVKKWNETQPFESDSKPPQEENQNINKETSAQMRKQISWCIHTTFPGNPLGPGGPTGPTAPCLKKVKFMYMCNSQLVPP